MTAFTAEPAAEHADVRAGLSELVGRFLRDYERAARSNGLTLAQARVLGFAACEPPSSAGWPSTSGATRRTSA